MPIVRVSLNEQPVTPWKNGQGSTRQVAVDPPGATLAQGFRWRVSRAVVGQDGPFSPFPGVDRTLWLLRGAALTLVVDGQERRLERAYDQVAFPGEAAVVGRLGEGPTEDLNLMHDRSQVDARSTLVRLRALEAWSTRVAAPGQDLLLLLEGALHARGGQGPPQRLQAGEALRQDDGAADRSWSLLAGHEPVAALLVHFSRAAPGS